MKRNPTTSTPLPKELPALAVLGLTDPAGGDWVRLRGLQYAGLAKASGARAALHLLAAAATIVLLIGQIGAVALGIWLALLGAFLLHAMRADRQ